MATLRKRNNKWHVPVRRNGQPSQYNSFISKTDAHKWARQIEGEMDKAVFPIDKRILEELTAADLFKRYRDTVFVLAEGGLLTIREHYLIRQLPWPQSEHDLSFIMYFSSKFASMTRAVPDTLGARKCLSIAYP